MRPFLFRSLFLAFLLSPIVTAQAAALEKIIYAGSPNLSVPVIVALDQGYFADEGLEVDYQPIQTGKLAMEALLAGRAQFASLVHSNVAYAGFQTDDLRIIASLGPTPDDAVIFPADSSIQSAADLKGKRIGLAMATTSQIFLIRLLARQGLTWNDITPVVLQPPTGIAALKGGQIDAFVTWQPWRESVRRAYNGKVREIKNDPSIYLRQTLCVATHKWLAQHPDTAVRLLRALIHAENFVRQHPDDTVKIVAKRSGQDIEMAQSYFAQTDIGLNADILPPIEDFSKWVIAHQQDFVNKSPPDYRKNIASDYLKAIAPERVEKGL